MNTSILRRIAGGCGLLLALAALTACQPTVYLMPTPEALQTGKYDPFALDPERNRDNRLIVAYATNRLPAGAKKDRAYLTLFDQDLRLGAAWVSIGGDEMSWEDLHQVSISAEREGDIPLRLERAEELARVDGAGDAPLLPGAEAFFDAVNRALADSLDKDLTLYVHGANNNFYRASAQAAQYRHFTGRNSVVMSFAWPSAESLLRYAVDVNNARRTVPVFASLLELLADHTDARRIDVLAYSAGSQVLSPALAALAEKYRDEPLAQVRERLRLGEIYFAAPDVEFRGFLEDLAGYVGIPDHVTVAVNPDDTVLALAAMKHGVSRAGRPDRNELSEEETQWVIKASRELPVDFIWISASHLPGMARGAHDFWYSHPWVSTDVLIQLLFEARPADRGLEAEEESGQSRVWYFPDDYPQRSTAAIDRLKIQQ